MLGFMLFSMLFTIVVERSVMAFRPLKPEYCSIYDRYFWQHERLWKLLTGAPFGGTPFKSMFMRLLGTKVGTRLYDAGCGIPEKTLVTIGDDCALNEGTVLQGHSLEDGTFKSGRIVLGDRCTVGVEAFVHYGVTMHDGSTLAADAFLMKGEEVAENTTYVGNPAREVSTPQADPQSVPLPRRAPPPGTDGFGGTVPGSDEGRARRPRPAPRQGGPDLTGRRPPAAASARVR